MPCAGRSPKATTNLAYLVFLIPVCWQASLLVQVSPMPDPEPNPILPPRALIRRKQPTQVRERWVPVPGLPEPLAVNRFPLRAVRTDRNRIGMGRELVEPLVESFLSSVLAALGLIRTLQHP